MSVQQLAAFANLRSSLASEKAQIEADVIAILLKDDTATQKITSVRRYFLDRRMKCNNEENQKSLNETTDLFTKFVIANEGSADFSRNLEQMTKNLVEVKEIMNEFVTFTDSLKEVVKSDSTDEEKVLTLEKLLL